MSWQKAWGWQGGEGQRAKQLENRTREVARGGGQEWGIDMGKVERAGEGTAEERTECLGKQKEKNQGEPRQAIGTWAHPTLFQPPVGHQCT